MPQESSLLERIALGDGQALTEWFHRHKNTVYRFAFYRVDGDPDLAADITQATFASALERLERFDAARGEMGTWLCWLSRNIIRDELSQTQRGQSLQRVWDQIDESLHDALLSIDNQELPEEVVQRKETRALVGAALANLPNKYRELLEAKYIQQLTLDAIARQRQTTIDGIKSMLKRARAAFRECFLAIAQVEVSDV